MINIYDGNNYYRKQLETDHTGLAPRGILNAMQMSQDINIWCWDGLDANARRREYYPEYKRNRKPLEKDIYAGFDLLKDVLRHTNVIQIEVPGYEADDVIATVTRQYAHRDKIAIYSNDYDLLQLASEFPDRVFVGAQPKASVPNKSIRAYKCLVGDPSDNIPGIKGFGEKAWESLTPKMAEALLACVMSEHEDNLDGYNITKQTRNWLENKDNVELLRKFWYIVTLMSVPLELIHENTVKGDGNSAAAEAILKEFML